MFRSRGGLTDTISPTSGVAVALGVQFAHAMYQALLFALAPFAVWSVASPVGFAVALGALAYSYETLATTIQEANTQVAPTEGESTSAAVVDQLEHDRERLWAATQTLRASRNQGADTRRASESGADTPDGTVTVPDGGVESTETEAVGAATPEEYEQFMGEFQTAVSATGSGDLTYRLDIDSPTDSGGALAESYNETVAEFERTITTATDFSDGVEGSAEQVTTAIETVKDASESVAETVQGIVEVFHKQHEQVETITAEASEISGAIEEVAASTDQVSETAQRTEERTQEGIEAGTDAQVAMREIESQIDEVVEAIDALSEQMDEIGRIVDLIDDIADQTNILALNASIEAANAGESGAGFAVVADEVKQLAEETQDATDEIEQVVERAREQTETTVTEVEQMKSATDQGIGTVEESVDALEAINELAQETAQGVAEISDAADAQASSIEQVASIAEGTAETSAESVDEAQHIASIAEEQSLALGEMYVEAKMLSTRATQLSTLFDEYETSA
ncbi:methyl-accepting chemotaxis protein [Halovenus marina]|uniref:methyl-accepting chemotaxis protein n=1 Tax=Halovenus marina TaxID=3396621 RepID=UPI003F566139